jgi:hypothetical protein
MLQRMVAEALAARIANAMFGEQGAAGKGGSGGGGGWIGTVLSSFGSWLFGSRASGGPVSAGRGYLVGERGPEVFVPGSTGRIESAQGRPITINVNVAAQPGMNRQTALQQGAAVGEGVRRAMARNT